MMKAEPTSSKHLYQGDAKYFSVNFACEWLDIFAADREAMRFITGSYSCILVGVTCQSGP